MNRLLKIILNLYFIFTGVFLILDNHTIVLYYWILSWLLYFLINHLGDKNGPNN